MIIKPLLIATSLILVSLFVVFCFFGHLVFPVFFVKHTPSPRQVIYAMTLCAGEDRSLGYARFADFGDRGARDAVYVLNNSKDPEAKATAAWVLESYASSTGVSVYGNDIVTALVSAVERDPWEVKIKALASAMKYGGAGGRELAIKALDGLKEECGIEFASKIMDELSTVELSLEMENRIYAVVMPRAKGKSSK